MTNDVEQRFIAVAQVCILAALLLVGWQVRGIRKDEAVTPMSRTTEWAQPGGKLERFQSFREHGESFHDFRIRHEAAVLDLSGG